jgi:hypothetical protein
MEMNDQLRAPLRYPTGKREWCTLGGRLSGPTVRLHVGAKEKSVALVWSRSPVVKFVVSHYNAWDTSTPLGFRPAMKFLGGKFCLLADLFTKHTSLLHLKWNVNFLDFSKCFWFVTNGGTEFVKLLSRIERISKDLMNVSSTSHPLQLNLYKQIWRHCAEQRSLCFLSASSVSH